MGAIGVFVVPFAFLIWSAAPAYADVSPGENSESSTSSKTDALARQTFLDGLALYEAGDYDAAIELFNQSYESSKRSKILFNVANALERQGNHLAAAQMLRRYIDSNPPPDNRGLLKLRAARLDDRAEIVAAEIASAEEMQERFERLQAATTVAMDKKNAAITADAQASFWNNIPWVAAPTTAFAVAGALITAGLAAGFLWQKSLSINDCLPDGGICSRSSETALQNELYFSLAADGAAVSTAILTAASGLSWVIWAWPSQEEEEEETS